MTYTKKRTVFVTGATGQVGLPTVVHLLHAGFHVKALVRDQNSEKARNLQLLGAELFQGNMKDKTRLSLGMENAFGVVSIQPQRTGKASSPNAPKDLTENDQIVFGKNVAEAAQEVGVEHFVYCSVAMNHKPLRIHYAKHTIENCIKNLDLPYTIFRPHSFMENYQINWWSHQPITLSSAVFPDIEHYLIAADDIGAFIALAIERPQRFLGKIMELAGDKLDIGQMAEILTDITQRNVKMHQITSDMLKLIDEQLPEAFDVINSGTQYVNIGYLRKMHPELSTFRQWVSKKSRAGLSKMKS